MKTTKPTKTISQVFEEFLADQKGRISAKTFSKYQSIIQLYGSYLESYWPGHDGEYDKITKAGGTYCGTFGPEDATEGYSEFLGYFMPRKVMCGKDTMQAAGTVTKKLAKWLAEKGYIEDNRQGRIAADNIFGRTARYRGTQGTAIVRVFDRTAAMTGASEKVLKRANRTYRKVYVHPTNHAGYYPGAQAMTLKLLFDPGDGKVLGRRPWAVTAWTSGSTCWPWRSRRA